MKSAAWGEARSRILPGTEQPEATTSSTARFPGFCSRLKSPVLALYSLGIHRKFGANSRLLELFLAGVQSLPADLISAARALSTIDPESHDS